MLQNKNIQAFLELVRAGLWEQAGISHNLGYNLNDEVEWSEVYKMSLKQSVQGLVLQGIERLKNANVNLNLNQGLLLQWIGEVQMMEQTNKAMNQFIEKLVEKMRKADIYTVLVKGQGIAQCYDRPLWRPSGDVDLLLYDRNYKKAKNLLLPLSTDNKPDERYSKHLGMNIGQWYVEIHGTLRTGLTGWIDKEVDAVQRDVFCGGQVRSWNNGDAQVFLPAPDDDVFFVFTHFIKHFYKECMNLRQVCDWCRLLWTYRALLNHGVLESRICRAGLLSEWKAFAALAVEHLGMPIEAMPMYDESSKWSKRAKLILNHILKGKPYSKIRDTWAIAKIFPWHTIKFTPAIFFNVNGLKIRERLFN